MLGEPTARANEYGTVVEVCGVPNRNPREIWYITPDMARRFARSLLAAAKAVDPDETLRLEAVR